MWSSLERVWKLPFLFYQQDTALQIKLIFFLKKKSNLRARFSEKNTFTNFRVTYISKGRGRSFYWEQKPLEPKILRTLKGLLQQNESLIVRETKSGTFLRPPDLEGKF